jgi:hypothetical protein
MDRFEDLVEGKDYILLDGEEMESLLKDEKAQREGWENIAEVVHADRDYKKDARMLFAALSRLYSSASDEAFENAFDVLSDVSVDFRNEYSDLIYED